MSRRVLRKLNFVKAQEREVCSHKTHTRLAGRLFTASVAPLNLLERIKLRNRLSAAVIDFTEHMAVDTEGQNLIPGLY